MKALYGLPEKVEFCSRCVMSNQRPSSCAEYSHTKDSKKETIRFVDGVCEACRVAERKSQIDWKKREEDLWELCEKYRSKDGSWDVLIPVSGGKDSCLQSHILKHKFRMNPVTVTWSPMKYLPVGRENHDSFIQAGFDNFLVTPSGKTNRILTRLSIENIFHPFQNFILGQKFLGPRMAARLGVGLVFYGESEAEYGNDSAEFEKAERDHAYYVLGDQSKVSLGGVPIASLMQDYGLTKGDLSLYMPADPESQRGISVRYLGHYLKWKPQEAYYYAAENCGFQANPEGRTIGTFSKYSGLDDVCDSYHFWTTYIKFGIGRASYDASQEVRSGDITREEAQSLVRRFDGEYPHAYDEVMMPYLSITPEEFPMASRMFADPIMTTEKLLAMADRFRSPHLWEKRDNQWRLRHTVCSP